MFTHTELKASPNCQHTQNSIVHNIMIV